jgi:hypothetical protein
MAEPAGSEGGRGKTQTVLGFMLDFKFGKAAGLAFKKLRDSITKTRKDGSKDFTRLERRVSISIRKIMGEMVLWGKNIKNIGINDVIREIGDTFGGVAGIIADTLARPGAMFAGLTSVAANTGLSMEKTMIGIARETSLTASELKLYGDEIVKVSESMKAPMTQVQALAKRFASANVPIGDFASLMESAISVNRLTGQETAEVAEQVLRMRKQFSMSGTDINAFYNTLLGGAKASEADTLKLFGSIENLIQLVSTNLPEALRGRALTDAMKLEAVLGKTFEDSGAILGKFIEGMNNMDSAGFVQIRSIVGTLGGSVTAMEDAIRNNDMVGAFKELHKAVAGANQEQLDQFRLELS